ncbi:unnamed protein product [Musa acuminata subsp. burmannicoides]|uniref:(wild Malaysian banana) hypothetical protein n=1 Tax=Musa acuminata subsp. malaccensis TaxID=214687 RepID=A0A804I4K5_MUSAM|nr:PREDICTED: uncharacterized protein LOC103975255 [Musa acuminata subsp. malaccensis]CAG1862540.1 unnamed protein product [Musa acuminata subsp. malaccensis]
MQTRVHPSHKTLGVLFTSLFSRFLLSPLLAFLPFPVCTRPRVQLRSRNLMEKQDLDFVLVPLGLLSLVAYHLWLLYRISRHPTTTVIGINAINRRIWVQTMMEDPAKNGVLAVQTLRNNIMASTLLASTAIMLSSLIVVLMTNGGSSSRLRGRGFVVGDTSDLGLSIKFFSILVCFLLAFLLNVQSIRYYSHAGILVNVPVKSHRAAPALAAEFVARALNRGSYFWSLGLRAFYFSFPLFLWVFGPIPMASCCFVLVVMLYFLDVYSGWGEERAEEEMEGWVGRVTVHGDC